MFDPDTVTGANRGHGAWGSPRPSRRLAAGALAAVAAVHAALLLDWSSATPPRYSLGMVRPIQASIIGREQPDRQPAAVRPAPPMPRRETPIPAPAPRARAEPLPQSAAEPATRAGAGAEQAAVVPPRFDADYLDNPAPKYPPVSRRLGEQGQVLVRVFVDAAGRPAQVELDRSSRYPRLDAAAIEAVRHWRFVPALRGQQPLGTWVVVPVVFSIRS